ncbi:dimethyl sulfoxide reductase anchor subunit [Schinkia azotoformans]|uniref:Putative anaerobic DMSO reductase chain C anchor subunit n=1 Tax=Schinkia azotoformans LMG 9581 TaxID=1131731 RepID=K6CWJ5_SCHAZ|nr:DmsC/YnfH family molybdoenzyme membrane anchor subunit [Schinkia azotoformans]EKN64602.1 putative anaerobic DMSO reductase chain C anchor subunit [Schinkia azotoformans LMG 9581]MEC1637909.1 dimethyl sulfoxide reductase anchor subunit [Schinkia azotoformans]MEC1721700.1 dimethyl sulfoxide reductase anchor subunit [Schinkia azotoformans]MEC1944805.1 dimethyl sulfoxide reductase anchor subunit [Schinkia azotoformans]MED4352067.1 dimethyl sulfoxide reductase anchor subunit [Schinkia azotoforma
MDAYEIPLVVFTVFIQWAAGIVIAMVLLEFLKPKFMETIGKTSLKKSMYIAFTVSVIGTIASVFHLGNPLKSYTSLLGSSHSWLSREIITVILFNALLLLSTYIWWKMSDKANLRKGIGTLTAVMGIITVVVSGMVYFSMTLHPAWNNWTTFANFLLTGLLLGALTVSYFALKGKNDENGMGENVTKVLGSYLGLIVVALVVTIGSSFMASGNTSETTAVAAVSVSSVLFWIRIISSLLVPATLIIYFVVAKKVDIVNYVLMAACFVLIGELSGRAMFYYSVMKQYPWF